MKIAFLAILAAFLSSPAFSNPSSSCPHPANLLLQSARAQHYQIYELSAPARHNIQISFNRQPPRTNVVLSHVYVVDEGIPVYWLMLVDNNGCTVNLSPALSDVIVKLASGEGNGP